MLARTSLFAAALICLLSIYGSADTHAESVSEAPLAHQLAQRVTIYRDGYGVPHIDARDLPAAAFAFGFCQCEDYFWQVEDSTIWALGRYAEINGKSALESDLITHSFEIPSRSRIDYEQTAP
jgi:acyl-homoserine lactone acylase PvdQ